jgi:tetratricopeptide (TPR) repeat protein
VPRSPRAEAWWPSALILALVAAIYLPSLTNGFTYDDDAVVPGVASLLNRPGAVHRFLSKDYFFSGELTYRPIVTLTYVLDWKLGGGTPFAFHVQSLVWQLIAVGCPLVLLKRSGVSPFVRYGAAALYGVHPVLTEAIDSIAFREDVLVTALGLLGLVVATGSARGRPSNVRLIFSLTCFLAAMFAKESGVVFLLLLPLTHWMFESQTNGSDPWRPGDHAREYVALSACTVGYLFVRFVLLPSPVVYAERIGGSMINSIATGLVAVGDYLRLLVYPHPLCADYRGVVAPVQSLLDWRPWASLLVVAAVTTFAWASRRRNALGWWGWAWFLIAVGPVSNVVALATPVAERFMHLPFVGLVVFAVSSVASVATASREHADKWTITSRGASRVLWIGASVLVVALGSLTWTRHAAWASNETLWRTTLADYPESVGALHGYGSVLVDRHREAEAVPYLKRALESTAAGHDARSAILLDLGSAYYAMGQFDLARQSFESSIAESERPKAYFNLGLTLVRLQRPNDAEEKLRAALRLEPDMAEAHSALGGVFAMQGKTEQALAEYREAVRLNPSLASAHANLGVALANKGQAEDAIDELLRAIDLDPNQSQWRYNVAALLAQRGRRDAAIEQLEAALRINPEFTQARDALRSLGR